jgi:DNA-binding transcriptional MerR regulator
MSDQLKKIQKLVGSQEKSEKQVAGPLVGVPTSKEQEADLKAERDELLEKQKQLAEEHKRRALANLEKSGYDYEGREFFRNLMRRVGRAR